jgi:sugar/nucleoside kinase (ribokinase family)
MADKAPMQALFIGQTYIDVTMLPGGAMPTGDDKAVARDYAISFGGNAVAAAFCCARLGIAPDLIGSLANDWLGHMFWDMAGRYGIALHPRQVRRSSLSFVLPNNGKRAILRARDDDYLHPFPQLNLAGCRALHLDGHQADAALHYAKACREAGILTSLDGGGIRSNTEELLTYIDVAIVSERMREQYGLSETDLLARLKAKGCRIAGITQGERGMIWYDETGEIRRMPAFPVPTAEVIDTTGAGDIFHGAYIYSLLSAPEARWERHFRFASAASAHSVRYLGIEASLPTRADVERLLSRSTP